MSINLEAESYNPRNRSEHHARFLAESAGILAVSASHHDEARHLLEELDNDPALVHV